MKEENDRLRSDITSLQVSYSQLKSSFEAMKIERSLSFSHIENQLPAYDVESEQLKIERDRMKQEISVLNTKWISFKESFENVTLEKSRLEDTAITLQKTIASLEHSNRLLLTEKNKLQNSLNINVEKHKELN